MHKESSLIYFKRVLWVPKLLAGEVWDDFARNSYSLCASCGRTCTQSFFSNRSKSSCNSKLPLSVTSDPIKINFRLARVTATLTRRQSLSRSPTLECSLLRTNDTIMHDLSLPWYLSTVLISISFCLLLRKTWVMSLSWCLYGEIIPSDEGWRPAFKSAHANWCTNKASVSLDTRCSERVSGAGTPSVSRKTTGRLGTSASRSQLSGKRKIQIKLCCSSCN